MNFLKSLFGRAKKSVDDIVEDIAVKIDSLHIAADLHEAEAAVHKVEISVRLELQSFATAEAERARRIAAKIKDLLS